jgi:hypothetical protein
MERIATEHQRALENIRLDEQRRREDLERTFRMQIEADGKAHERELRSLSSNADGKLAVDKVMAEERIRVLTEQLAQARSDIDRLKTDLADKSDLPKQMNALRESATAIGMVMDQGGGESAAPTWKEHVAEVAKELAPRLPDLLRAAGETFARTRAPAAQAPVAQAAPMPMMQHHAAPPAQMHGPRLHFATESGIEPRASRVQAAPLPVTASMYPPNMPAGMGEFSPQVPSVLETSMPDMAVPMPPMPPQTQAPAPMPPNMHPATPMQQQAPSMPPPPPAGGPESVDDQQIMMFKDQFEAALSGGYKPEQFAADLKEKFGAEMVRQIGKELNADRIIAAFRRNAPDSPLIKMKGRKWLHAVDVAIKAI